MSLRIATASQDLRGLVHTKTAGQDYFMFQSMLMASRDVPFNLRTAITNDDNLMFLCVATAVTFRSAFAHSNCESGLSSISAYNDTQ